MHSLLLGLSGAASAVGLGISGMLLVDLIKQRIAQRKTRDHAREAAIKLLKSRFPQLSNSEIRNAVASAMDVYFTYAGPSAPVDPSLLASMAVQIIQVGTVSPDTIRMLTDMYRSYGLELYRQIGASAASLGQHGRTLADVGYDFARAKSNDVQSTDSVGL